MDRYKHVVSGAVLLAALLTLFAWIGTMYIHTNALARYTYEPAGFSFTYSSQYGVTETARDTEGVTVVIAPVQTTTKNQPVFDEALPDMRCVLSPNKSNIPLPVWIRSAQYSLESGHLLSGTEYPSADILNKDALGFKTDGLYASDHVAFEHNGYIIDCSVGYITIDDPLRMDFTDLLGRIELSEK